MTKWIKQLLCKHNYSISPDTLNRYIMSRASGESSSFHTAVTCSKCEKGLIVEIR